MRRDSQPLTALGWAGLRPGIKLGDRPPPKGARAKQATLGGRALAPDPSCFTLARLVRTGCHHLPPGVVQLYKVVVKSNAGTVLCPRARAAWQSAVPPHINTALIFLNPSKHDAATLAAQCVAPHASGLARRGGTSPRPSLTKEGSCGRFLVEGPLAMYILVLDVL